MRKFVKKTLIQGLQFGLHVHKNIPSGGRFRALKMAMRAAKAEVNGLAMEVWDSFSVDDQLTMVHFINTHFSSPNGDVMSLAGFGWHFQMERKTLQNVWMSKDEMDMVDEVEKHFRQSTLTRASARNHPSCSMYPQAHSVDLLGWPVDFSPAKTEEEAIVLLRSRTYRWSLMDDGTGTNSRKFGLTPVVITKDSKWSPIRTPDYGTDQEEVLVIKPMARSIQASVPIIAIITNDNDAAASEQWWDALEAAAATEDELAEIQAKRPEKVPVDKLDEALKAPGRVREILKK